jgi:hypothetical protein
MRDASRRLLDIVDGKGIEQKCTSHTQSCVIRSDAGFRGSGGCETRGRVGRDVKLAFPLIASISFGRTYYLSVSGLVLRMNGRTWLILASNLVSPIYMPELASTGGQRKWFMEFYLNREALKVNDSRRIDMFCKSSTARKK